MSALTKFLAKSADFLPPRAAALVEERIAALKAVREMVSGKANKIGNGFSADVYSVGDKLEGAGKTVVKKPQMYHIGDGPDFEAASKENIKEFKRRGFLESILADKDLAPRTMLVETSKGKYLVQPRADSILGASLEMPYYRGGKAATAMTEKVEKAGLTSNDVMPLNMGKYGDKFKYIDAGHEQLTRAMTPAERASALEKFISKGKRKKPWLDE